MLARFAVMVFITVLLFACNSTTQQEISVKSDIGEVAA